MIQIKVSMYVCGPTIYNYIHLGNARFITNSLQLKSNQRADYIV